MSSNGTATAAPLTIEDLRRSILEAEDIVITPVATPEWAAVDGAIYVRTMTGLQRSRYLRSIRSDGGTAGPAVEETSQLKLALATMCTAHGALIFTDPADLAPLVEKSCVALKRVVDLASTLNGFSDTAAEAAKNGSASTRISGSSTDSRSH